MIGGEYIPGLRLQLPPLLTCCALILAERNSNGVSLFEKKLIHGFLYPCWTLDPIEYLSLLLNQSQLEESTAIIFITSLYV